MVRAEREHAAWPEPVAEDPQPVHESRLRQMGEERGDENRVERLIQSEILGPDGRDDGMHPEPLPLEAEPVLVDVRDPETLRRDLPHQEAGDATITAGEVEDLDGPVSETPAQDLQHGIGNAQARAEVGEQGTVAVALHALDQEGQHLVPLVDGHVQASRIDVEIGQEGGHRGAHLVGTVRETHTGPGV